MKLARIVFFGFCLSWFSPQVHAYIGPGIGLQFIGYFVMLFFGVGAAFLMALGWPVYQFFKGRKKKDPSVEEESGCGKKKS